LFLFIFFALFNNGFGGNARNAYEQCATQGQMTDQFSFEAIRQGQADIVSAVKEQNSNVIGTVKDTAYNNLGALRDVGSSVDALQPAIENCCCNILRANDQTRFDMANYACQIEKVNTENTQRILDAMTANRMADLQNENMRYYISSQLCGVVKYPTSMSFNAGPSPFCGGGCGCGCGCS
jgi:hypothetical protein